MTLGLQLGLSGGGRVGTVESVRIYTGGTVTPAGWSTDGGSLSYVGNEVFSPLVITAIQTTGDGDLDGAIDVTGLPLLRVFRGDNNVLASVDIGGLLHLNTFSVANNPLTAITGLTGLTDAINSVNCSGCALTEAAVDAILVALAATTAIVAVDLSGGTSAPPSATGLTAKATIEGRGGAVTVNS